MGQLITPGRIKPRYLVQKKQPNFDSRIYGFEKLTPLIDSTGRFEIERRENQRGRFKLIYVRKKVKGRS